MCTNANREMRALCHTKRADSWTAGSVADISRPKLASTPTSAVRRADVCVSTAALGVSPRLRQKERVGGGLNLTLPLLRWCRVPGRYHLGPWVIGDNALEIISETSTFRGSAPCLAQTKGQLRHVPHANIRTLHILDEVVLQKVDVSLYEATRLGFVSSGFFGASD